jgi:hypothetical protein
MRLHFKCVLVVIKTTTKATISIHWSVLQNIKSWVLEYLPLFLSFFLPSFVLVCFVFFLNSLFLPILISSLSLSLYFIALLLSSLPLSLFLSLYVISEFLLSIPSLTITLSIFATGFCPLPFPHPLYIIWFFLVTVKLTFSLNTFYYIFPFHVSFVTTEDNNLDSLI